jgi:hypothetical protein
MRVLGPVVGHQTAIVFCHKANSSEGGRVRSKFVGHNPGWREALLLEQLLHQLSSGIGVSPVLGEEVHDLPPGSIPLASYDCCSHDVSGDLPGAPGLQRADRRLHQDQNSLN